MESISNIQPILSIDEAPASIPEALSTGWEMWADHMGQIRQALVTAIANGEEGQLVRLLETIQQDVVRLEGVLSTLSTMDMDRYHIERGLCELFTQLDAMDRQQHLEISQCRLVFHRIRALLDANEAILRRSGNDPELLSQLQQRQSSAVKEISRVALTRNLTDAQRFDRECQMITDWTSDGGQLQRIHELRIQNKAQMDKASHLLCQFGQGASEAGPSRTTKILFDDGELCVDGEWLSKLSDLANTSFEVSGQHLEVVNLRSDREAVGGNTPITFSGSIVQAVFWQIFDGYTLTQYVSMLQLMSYLGISTGADKILASMQYVMNNQPITQADIDALVLICNHKLFSKQGLAPDLWKKCAPENGKALVDLLVITAKDKIQQFIPGLLIDYVSITNAWTDTHEALRQKLLGIENLRMNVDHILKKVGALEIEQERVLDKLAQMLPNCSEVITSPDSFGFVSRLSNLKSIEITGSIGGVSSYIETLLTKSKETLESLKFSGALYTLPRLQALRQMPRLRHLGVRMDWRATMGFQVAGEFAQLTQLISLHIAEIPDVSPRHPTYCYEIAQKLIEDMPNLKTLYLNLHTYALNEHYRDTLDALAASKGIHLLL